MVAQNDIDTIIATLQEFAAEINKHSAGALLQIMRRVDLSMPQVVALLYLHRRSTASISDISEYLNLSLGATSHLVDRLVCGTFVQRTEDQNDRRQKQITLTDAGAALVQEFRQIRVEEMARRVALAPQPLLDALLQVMDDVVEYLRDNDAHLDEPLPASRSAAQQKRDTSA